MMTDGNSLPQRPAWKALAAHHLKIEGLHLRGLFASDPNRGERLALVAAGIYLDYSKNRITDETLDLLLQLAEEAGLRARIDAMFNGKKINSSEKRAVLHVALRARSWSTAKTWYQKSARYSIAWPISPIGCAVAHGLATPAREFGT
jgi:glucose-6-phosphate isomerase